MGKIRTFIGGFSAWWGGGKGRRKKSGKSTHAKQRDLRLEPLESAACSWQPRLRSRHP